MVLPGTEDGRFRLAAEDPGMGVSGTETAEKWAEEALRGQGLGGIWSDKT